MNKSFADLGLSKLTQELLIEIGYHQPSDIQAMVIPSISSGKDVIGRAETGSGKTAAFALPLIEKINTKISDTQVLVLAPTRELALQINDAFRKYSKNKPKINFACIYGGQNYSTQLRDLNRGAHVVIGTPGRIIDHLQRKSLKLEKLKTFVLDEADEMLRMGFIDDVDSILENTPDKKQIALFSATMPKQIQRIANKYLVEPEIVNVKQKSGVSETIEQAYCMVKSTNKSDALVKILNFASYNAAIIFVKTKAQTTQISESLAANGFKVEALNGDIKQNVRERTIKRLKQGNIDIVIATDVAARGLDVERLSLVINYDLPTDLETYIHRIGRTGRAGRVGHSISLITGKGMRIMQSIANATKREIVEFKLPSKKQVYEKKIEKLKDKIQSIQKNINIEQQRNFIKQLVGKEFELIDVAACLAYMVAD